MQASYGDQSAAVPLPADWLTFVAEVRSSIEDLSRALERMQAAVDALASASSASDGLSPAEGEAPAGWSEVEESAQDEPERALDLAEPVVAEAAPELDPEAIREQVRLEVERARAEIASGGISLEDAPAADESPALVLDGLAATEAAPELDLAEPTVTEATPELDPEAVREQVRLEVERARAEIASGRIALEDAVEADGEPAESLGRLSPLAATFLEPQYEQRAAFGAPMLVIDDAEGRVELVRVYDALARVGLTGEATLITYAPHTVKIGIDSPLLPEDEAVAAAVKAAFGRPCRVTREGNRITVTVSDRPASAA